MGAWMRSYPTSEVTGGRGWTAFHFWPNEASYGLRYKVQQCSMTPQMGARMRSYPRSLEVKGSRGRTFNSWPNESKYELCIKYKNAP